MKKYFLKSGFSLSLNFLSPFSFMVSAFKSRGGGRVPINNVNTPK